MVLGFLFGWKWKVRKLRKRWDRLREGTLKKGQPMRGELLKELDTIEQSIRALEEENLTRQDRVRLMKETEKELKVVKEKMKGNEEIVKNLVGI
ncbi:MAG: hypothetical protein ISS36_00400 [Candidatus Aenigmarchaeota archaeon]|nr:hypothetical protein [Candidatus Aenigmarchaeota archaeon]